MTQERERDRGLWRKDIIYYTIDKADSARTARK